MRRYFILLAFLVNIPLLNAQKNNDFGNKENIPNGITFGLAIRATQNGVTQFFLVKQTLDGKKVEGTLPIQKRTFIRQAMGLEESEANPTGENLFIKYNVFDSAKVMRIILDSIDLPNDPADREYVIRQNFENIFYELASENIAQLWRLRYAVYPFNRATSDTLGWTHNFKAPLVPTEAQMKILSEFGFKNISDLIYGENVFKLMHAITQRDWVLNYIAAGPPDADK